MSAQYYDALSQCVKRYRIMADATGVHDITAFSLEFENGVKNNLPLMKLNRWLGYIQGALITRGITTVEEERDWTRPLFRPLDFAETGNEIHSHCNRCGTPYPALVWPRVCSACNHMEWNSPKPVVVVLQPVFQDNNAWGGRDTGLAIAKRAILPEIGRWSLIAGYVDPKDTCLEDAVEREFVEETGLKVMSRPRYLYSVNSHRNNMMAFMIIDTPMPIEVWRTAKCCAENSELAVLWSDSKRDIAFPLHEDAMKNYFEGKFWK
jgi:hypothetical protein